jgi:hypothetical protein
MDKHDSWQDKACSIIAKAAWQGYIKANFRNGKKYKRHRPYSLPVYADELVDCLNRNAEEQAKAIFIRLAYGLV